MSAHDLTIHGYALAGTDAHAIAHPDSLDRQLQLAAIALHARRFRLQVEEALHRLRAASLDDQRQPFREDVIGGDHHRDGEERRRRIAGWGEGQADHAADNAGKGTGLEQHMLVQDAAAQRLGRHHEDVAPDPEHEEERHRAQEPRGNGRKPGLVFEEHEREGGRAQADRAADGGQQAARA